MQKEALKKRNLLVGETEEGGNGGGSVGPKNKGNGSHHSSPPNLVVKVNKISSE
jgi:hypothetical protein